jgi:chemotaxis protein MotA
MFAIVGIVVVFGAIVAGYLMEKGNLLVLVQPAELIIIGGAALGTLLIANPLHIIKAMLNGVTGVLKPSPFSKTRYLNTLKMMFEFLNKIRKEGLLSVENDVEKPKESVDLQEISGVSRRPPRLRLCLRHAAHGNHRRRRALRYGPDDGA